MYRFHIMQAVFNLRDYHSLVFGIMVFMALWLRVAYPHYQCKPIFQLYLCIKFQAAATASTNFRKMVYCTSGSTGGLLHGLQWLHPHTKIVTAIAVLFVSIF